MLLTDELQSIYNGSKSLDECKNRLVNKISSEVMNTLQKFSENVNAYGVLTLKTEIVRLNNQWNYVCELFNKDDRFDVDWTYDIVKTIIKNRTPALYEFCFSAQN